MYCVGMVICDMSVPGCPLAHLNTAFTDLTGYQKDKIGTNCKFLQVRTHTLYSLPERKERNLFTSVACKDLY